MIVLFVLTASAIEEGGGGGGKFDDGSRRLMIVLQGATSNPYVFLRLFISLDADMLPVFGCRRVCVVGQSARYRCARMFRKCARARGRGGSGWKACKTAVSANPRVWGGRATPTAVVAGMGGRTRARAETPCTWILCAWFVRCLQKYEREHQLCGNKRERQLCGNERERQLCGNKRELQLCGKSESKHLSPEVKEEALNRDMEERPSTPVSSTTQAIDAAMQGTSISEHVPQTPGVHRPRGPPGDTKERWHDAKKDDRNKVKCTQPRELEYSDA